MGADSEQAQRGGLLILLGQRELFFVHLNSRFICYFLLTLNWRSHCVKNYCTSWVHRTWTWNSNWSSLRTLCMHFVGRQCILPHGKKLLGISCRVCMLSLHLCWLPPGSSHSPKKYMLVELMISITGKLPMGVNVCLYVSSHPVTAVISHSLIFCRI